MKKLLCLAVTASILMMPMMASAMKCYGLSECATPALAKQNHCTPSATGFYKSMPMRMCRRKSR